MTRPRWPPFAATTTDPSPASTVTARTADPPDLRAAWWAVGAMTVPLFLLSQDFFGVTVALPAIGADLHASTATLEWTINAFLLAFAAPLIAVGRISDIVGRRTVALVGIAVFGVGSLLCGTAQTAGWLIAARVVQGLAAAMLFSTSLSIVSNAFPDDRRATGIGVWTAVGCVGGAVGPLVGGFFTAVLSWRWFFLVNLPLVALGFVVTLLKVDESRDPSARGVDWSGLVLITGGLVALTLGLQAWPTEGLRSPMVLGPLAVGVIFIIGFLVLESRIADPLVDLGLFRRTPYLSATGVAFIENYVFSATSFVLTLYLQDSLGLGPLQTGLVFLASSVPFALLSPFMGRVVARFGVTTPMVVAMVVAASSCALLSLISGDTGVPLVVGALILQAVGLVTAYDVSTTAAMGAVPEEKAGVGSGVISGLRISAMVLGVSVSTIVFDAVAGDEPATRAEYASGVRAAMLVAMAVALVGIVVARASRGPARVAPITTPDDGAGLAALVAAHPFVPGARHHLGLHALADRPTNAGAAS
ncbi:MAG: MFS transporter [Acidimicrobiales bacterium]